MNRTLTGYIDRVLAKPVRYLFQTPAKLLKARVDRGMTVLDVGCGEGYYSLGMAKLVGPAGRVIAVDTEPGVVAFLKTRAEEAGLSGRIDARVCSAEDLGISDLENRVDFALGVYVVHHAEDAGRLMTGVYCALKRGGRFLIVEPRHHASKAERESVESAGRSAGFEVAEHPRLIRDWAVMFVKA
jgi:ubiquinone/menaquinone biosynthesis C-methylase UbiE